jgi:hypothetical protein
VEERPFKGRVRKRKKSALPKAVAGERSSQTTGITMHLDVFRAAAALEVIGWQPPRFAQPSICM